MNEIDPFTAIITPPAACILAVGALKEHPVVEDHTLSMGHRMTVTLGCDHRAMGAAFLADLKAVVEEPLHLLL